METYKSTLAAPQSVTGRIYWARVVAFDSASNATWVFNGRGPGNVLVALDSFVAPTGQPWTRIDMTGNMTVQLSQDPAEPYPGATSPTGPAAVQTVGGSVSPVGVLGGAGAGQAFFVDTTTFPRDIGLGTGPVTLYSLSLVNTTAAAAFLQLWFRNAIGVTVGTTPPDHVVRLAANEHAVLTFPVGLGSGVGSAGMSFMGTTTPTGAVSAAISAGGTFTQ